MLKSKFNSKQAVELHKQFEENQYQKIKKNTKRFVDSTLVKYIKYDARKGLRFTYVKIPKEFFDYGYFLVLIDQQGFKIQENKESNIAKISW